MDIIEHKITLRGEKVVLRPITEYDWDVIWRWNYNPDALFFSEGRNLIKSSPSQIQEAYRHMTKESFGFIIDANDKPIGDCWLQKVNVVKILRDHPVKRCRCIDLLIGDMEFFSREFDIDIIRTVTKFGFDKENADMIFGCDIPDDNKQSLKAFKKVGYQIYDKVRQLQGSKSQYLYNVVLVK
ncbi:GNAT family N-acetyltransferase [bacterium]|nr:GNAT family N-acetyltransferase [bacterium]